MDSSSQNQSIPAPHGLAIRPWEGLLLALLAAAIVFGIVQATHPIFRMSGEVNVAMGRPTAEFLAVIHQNDVDNQKHAALYLGCLGLLTAGAMSLREAIARRAWLPPIVALPFGAIGGALGGMFGCMVLQHVRTNIGQAELKHLVETQLAVAVPLGLGVGLGFGLSARTLAGLMKATVAGLAAGAIAGVIYPVAVSVLLPTASTEVLLPEEASTRLLWLCVLAGFIGLVIPFAGRQREANKQPPPSAP